MEQDEDMREAYDNWDRPASSEVNHEFVERAEKYRKAIEKATAADETLRNKWLQWQSHIDILCRPEVCICDPDLYSQMGSKLRYRMRSLKSSLP